MGVKIREKFRFPSGATAFLLFLLVGVVHAADPKCDRGVKKFPTLDRGPRSCACHVPNDPDLAAEVARLVTGADEHFAC
jgi:hypothetical protein